MDDKEAPSLDTIQEELNRMTAKHELERKHRKNAESKISEFEKMAQDAHDAKAAEVEAARLEAAKKSGKVEEVDKSWADKYAALQSKLENVSKENQSKIQKITAGREALEIAQKVFGDNAKIALPHVEPFVTVEFSEDGDHSYRYLNDKGEATANSRDEFAQMLADKFPTIAVGSSASGGGANGANAKGGSAAQKTIRRAQFDSLDQAARHSLVKEGVKVTD